ncbi:MAG: fasciclin domain-containing protein [Anaerolineae bacterium]|nr:fasciclin domain-containing protein [Anaerolineae bacterium]
MRKFTWFLALIALLIVALPSVSAQDATPEVTPEATMEMTAEATMEAMPATGETIGDLVIGAAGDSPAQFTSLLAAVQAADPLVLETLTDPDAEITVFAPSDAAFAALQDFMGEEGFNQIMESPEVLANILTFHVVPGIYTTQDLMDALDANEGQTVTLPTLNGQHIDLSGSTSGNILIDGAPLNLDMADVTASNGVIHVIEAVIFPDDRTIDQVIVDMAGNEDTPEFTTLLSALSTADPAVLETLSDPDVSLTLFAPTDAAFEALGEDTLNTVLQDQQTLTNVLLYHVVNGRIYADDLAAQLSGEMMDDAATPTWVAGMTDDGGLQVVTSDSNGDTVTITSTDEGLFINDAQIVTRDIDATNGVIHVIDAVLMPGE